MGLLGLVHNTICGEAVANAVRAEIGNAAAGRVANLGQVSEEIASAINAGNNTEATRLLRTITGVSEQQAARLGSNLSNQAFEGILRGRPISLAGVRTQQVTYTKLAPEVAAANRQAFDSTGRRAFLQQLVGDESRVTQLRNAGLTNGDIALIRDGRVPQGWQVHHKIPIDAGGSNEFSNLVLIRNDPNHLTITNYQNALIRGMSPGETRVFEYPIVSGFVYPP